MVQVLINGLHAKTGGGVTYLRNMVPLLAADPELDVRLCLHENQRDAFGDLSAHCGIEWVGFRDGFARRLVWEQAALPRLARRLGADVTFSPANFGPLFAPGPVILLRNALAVAEEDKRPAKRAYWAALTVMTRLSLARCRRAIAVSEYARDALGAGGSDRVRVVHHGVNPMYSSPPESRARGDFLLSVGDIYVQKNLHRLIEALSLVPDVRLKVCGHPVDGDYDARVRASIREKGMEGRVEFLGRADPERLLELYRSCVAFVFPSTVETFGNPLVEAMACGAPVASSNAAAMPEVCGGAALLFPPHDAPAMADAIRRLVADEDLREKLSRQSLERAQAFSWKATAEKTAAVLKEA